MSGDLDSGSGEFYPADKYRMNGWLNYVQAYFSPDHPEAKKKETEIWWK